jgi:hypothetical protein
MYVIILRFRFLDAVVSPYFHLDYFHFMHYLFFHDTSFTMSDSTAKKIARKVITLPVIHNNAFISDGVLEQVVE